MFHNHAIQISLHVITRDAPNTRPPQYSQIQHKRLLSETSYLSSATLFARSASLFLLLLIMGQSVLLFHVENFVKCCKITPRDKWKTIQQFTFAKFRFPGKLLSKYCFIFTSDFLSTSPHKLITGYPCFFLSNQKLRNLPAFGLNSLLTFETCCRNCHFYF